MPTSLAFTGHMIDRPGRPVPRFPATAEAGVRARMAAELDQLDAVWGCASGTAGGDILFHELMHERGARTALVLPCPLDEFIDACIDGMPGADWKARLQGVLNHPLTESVEILSQQCAADNAMASECCSRVVLGLATMRAQQLNAAQPETKSALLALWDGRPGDQFGGTHSLFEFARARGHAVRVLEIGSAAPRADAYPLPVLPAGTTSAPRTLGGDRSSPQLICTVVFADVVGFSKLKERQLPAFAKHFLGGVMQLMLQSGYEPLSQNTWGDGLYLVFGSIRDAGKFALDLRDFVKAKNWTTEGLPEDLNVRIGVHAGPVYQIHDPIQGKPSYMGSHVTQAARIEPTTRPGEVFVSRTFAALAAAECLQEFAFADIGVVELAKGYGSMATYRMSRSGE